MVWVAGVLLVLLTLVLLGALAWRLWGAVKALGGSVGRISEVLDRASAGLEVQQPPTRR